MISFDDGSNFTTIVDSNNERAITLTCLENGEGLLQYEEGRFRAGVTANWEDLKQFLNNCLNLINKFED